MSLRSWRCCRTTHPEVNQDEPMPQQAKAPFQIRDEVLSAIRQAIVTLKSPECMLIVAKADRAVKNKWATTLLRFAEELIELELATI